ncbi:hypothetical protein GS463_29150 [Rhodococcus hoagii]|nr:hypothetical protein [Prescottella equi]
MGAANWHKMRGRREINMGMASKGARTRVVTRVPDEVAEALEEGRKNAGVESLSQYVADLLAYCTGNAALARELSPNQEKLMSQEVLMSA